MCGGDFVDDAVDAVLAGASGGAVGYQNGKVGTGYIQKNISGTEKGTKLSIGTLPLTGQYKKLTGVTAKEEALELQKQAVEDAQAKGLQDRADAQAANAANQLAASRSAGTIRKSGGSGGSSNKRSSVNSNLGGNDRDFLGL